MDKEAREKRLQEIRLKAVRYVETLPRWMVEEVERRREKKSDSK